METSDRHYTLGLNVFAYRTTDEVHAAYACQRSVVDGRVRHINVDGKLINVTPSEEKEGLPDTIDWRIADCNGHRAVRDQGQGPGYYLRVLLGHGNSRRAGELECHQEEQRPGGPVGAAAGGL